ncbi:uncharacterized protein V6R79_019802 [Siganus canaliculatus]
MESETVPAHFYFPSETLCLRAQTGNVPVGSRGGFGACRSEVRWVGCSVSRCGGGSIHPVCTPLSESAARHGGVRCTPRRRLLHATAASAARHGGFTALQQPVA